jgi:hypothetical protein
MEKNKTGKYFKYAIGEIVLVVIGILIALSINNWNENRKQNILEQSYLDRLKVDLNEDLKSFTFYKGLANLRIEQIEIVQKAVADSTVIKENSGRVIKSVEQVSWKSYLPISRITYSELISSGKLGLIKSEKLRDLIARYYKEIDHWEIVLKSSEYHKEFASHTTGILNQNMLIAIENSEPFSLSLQTKEFEYPIIEEEVNQIIERLMENNKAWDLFPRMYHYQILAKKVVDNLEHKCIALLESINELR